MSRQRQEASAQRLHDLHAMKMQTNLTAGERRRQEEEEEADDLAMRTTKKQGSANFLDRSANRMFDVAVAGQKRREEAHAKEEDRKDAEAKELAHRTAGRPSSNAEADQSAQRLHAQWERREKRMKQRRDEAAEREEQFIQSLNTARKKGDDSASEGPTPEAVTDRLLLRARARNEKLEQRREAHKHKELMALLNAREQVEDRIRHNNRPRKGFKALQGRSGFTFEPFRRRQDKFQKHRQSTRDKVRRDEDGRWKALSKTRGAAEPFLRRLVATARRTRGMLFKLHTKQVDQELKDRTWENPNAGGDGKGSGNLAGKSDGQRLFAMYKDAEVKRERMKEIKKQQEVEEIQFMNAGSVHRKAQKVMDSLPPGQRNLASMAAILRAGGKEVSLQPAKQFWRPLHSVEDVVHMMADGFINWKGDGEVLHVERGYAPARPPPKEPEPDWSHLPPWIPTAEKKGLAKARKGEIPAPRPAG